MEKVYLLDTCVWRFWYDKRPDIVERIKQLPKDSKIGLSVIVWGEIMYGAKVASTFDVSSYDGLFRSRTPKMLDVDEHVSEVYGELRSRLFDKFSDKYLRTKKKRPEQLINPATAKELGIQENDLWLVSQAITYNLVLVTNDQMKAIFAVTPKELDYELW